MKIRSNIQLSAIILGLSLALTACGGSGTNAKDDSAKNSKMTWVTTGNAPRSMQMAMYAVPQHLGFFKEEGLDVDLRFSEGSTAGIQAVVSGAGLVTNADVGSVLAARAENVPLKAFAGVVPNWPWQFAVLKDSPITQVSQLKGKKIGIISLASGSNNFARAALQDAGLNPDKDVKLLPVGAGAAASQSLESGKVDVLALYGEVYVPMKLKGIDLRLIDNPERFGDLYSIAFATTDANLRNKSDDIEKFSRAAFKGLVYASANPEAALDIAFKVFPDLRTSGESNEILLATLKEWLSSAQQADATPGDWTNIGAISTESWEATIKYTKDSGTDLSKVSVTDVWSDQILPELNKFDVRKIAQDAADYDK